MHRVALVSSIAVALFVAIAPATQAEMLHSIGRWAGIGWSDGYHSHTACPPKPHAAYRASAPAFNMLSPPQAPFAAPTPTPAAGPLPWWKVPASQTEHQPAETIQTPVTQ